MLIARRWSFTLGLWLLLAGASSARAQSDAPPPSAFAYGYRGFMIGAFAGLGAGYLAVRHDGVRGDEWKELVFGAGVGALVTAGAGIGLGLSAQGREDRWYPQLILRDSLYGVTFGALSGAAIGGLVALRSDDAEHVLLGAAIGSLIGLGVGATAGAIAASSAAERERQRAARERQGRARPSVNVTVSLLQGRRGVAGAGPFVYGRF